MRGDLCRVAPLVYSTRSENPRRLLTVRGFLFFEGHPPITDRTAEEHERPNAFFHGPGGVLLAFLASRGARYDPSPVVVTAP